MKLNLTGQLLPKVWVNVLRLIISDLVFIDENPQDIVFEIKGVKFIFIGY